MKKIIIEIKNSVDGLNFRTYTNRVFLNWKLDIKTLPGI